jgi:TorA maturation chaperone TorD
MGDTLANDHNAILKGYNMLLYFAGSMIMYEPVEECVVDFWSGGILKALPVSSRNPRFMEAAAQLRNSCKDKTMCISLLQQDFNRLLSTNGNPLAPAVKSGYYNRLPGALSENVGDFYNSYGWRYRSRFSIPDDNLGIELLFLTLLTEKYITFDDEACRNEMRNEIKRFIEKHILSWVPDWNTIMQEKAETLCYKGIANLIYACTEDIYNLFLPPATDDEVELALRN